MLKSIGFGDLKRLFSSSRRSVGSTFVDLCEILFGGSLGSKLQDDQQRFTRTSVLLAPLLALGFKSTSLSAGIHM